MDMFASKQIKLEPSPAIKRTPRTPKHSFYLKQKPFQIQPFMIAPVLANETMKNLLLQCRSVTDPIKNSLIGWHIEHYFFYVKLRDCQSYLGASIKSEVEAMVLQHENEPDSVMSRATSIPMYHAGTDQAAWTEACLAAVTNAYFREPSEVGALSTYAIDGMPAARINMITGLDSLALQSAIPTSTVETTASDLVIPELEAAYRAWVHARQLQVTSIDFEDYLATFGVKIPKSQNQQPELIRYARNWQYPSNTINSSTGAPTSAVSWAISERADKDRYFKEPGFLFGVQVVRPKVYLSGQNGSLAGSMTKSFDWLPQQYRDDVYSSLKKYENATGPLRAGFPTNAQDEYYLDLRDLLIYGDQYVNIAIDATTSGIALPDVVAGPILKTKYPEETMVDALFVTDGTDYVRTDGVVALTIHGNQKDET